MAPDVNEVTPAEDNVTEIGKANRTVHINGKDLPVEELEGKFQAKDENGNTYILNSLDQKRPTLVQQKRHQQRMERRKRLLNKGVPENQVDAMMAREDFDSMPVDKKLERLEKIFQGMTQKLAQDVSNIHFNQLALADAMDLNFRSMARMLTKLGIPPEEQKTLIEGVQAEMDSERREQAAKTQSVTAVAPADEGPVPDGATEFGG